MLNFGVELGVIQKQKQKYIVTKPQEIKKKNEKKILQKIYPQILVGVERKKAWFLALMFERQNRIANYGGENKREN